MRFADDVGDEINTDSSIGPAIAISPDGSRLAFISRTSDGKSHLSVRSIGGSQSTVLAGADGEGGPFAPFFSPDGRSIGFFANTKLKTISVEGGAAATVCDVGASPRGGFWGDDGHILFATQRTPVMRVPSLGGTPTPATELDSKQGEATNRFAQLLPGRKAILFSASKDNNVWENATVQVQTLADGKRKTLVPDGHFGRYMAAGPGNGHLLYVRNGTIFAAPMDLNRLELTGPSMPILEDVATRGQNGFSQFDVSASGTMVYVAGSNRRETRSLALVDASGKVQVLPAPPAAYQGVAEPSPDGTRLLVGIEQGSSLNLSVYELATNRTTRLTFLKAAPSGTGFRGIWTPDGKHIVFSIVSHELSGPGVYWTRADGAGEPHRILETPYQGGSFTPEGKLFAYSAGPSFGQSEFGIWTVPLELADSEHPKAGKPVLFLSSKVSLSPPFFSRDGKWLAYQSAETGMRQIFVLPFSAALRTATGGKWQVSMDGGDPPIRWTSDEKELHYSGLNGRPYVVAYQVNGDSFVASPSRVWLDKLPVVTGPPGMMPDGKHLIVILPSADAASARQTHVNFLLNFSDDLQRRRSSP